MKIGDIKKSLIGKRIRFFNGYSGALVGFEIAHVGEVVNAIVLRPSEGTSCVYVSKDHVNELIDKGYYCRTLEVNYGKYKAEWSIE